MSKYVDKIEFHNLLKEYRETKSPRAYEKIGKRFLLIATNYLNRPYFINYSQDWKDDMTSEAVFDMVRYIDNYDVDKMQKKLDKGHTPNPFAYFSQYAYNGIMRYLKEKKKDKEFLVKLPFIENIDKRDTYE